MYREAAEYAMKLHAQPFTMIKSGQKTVELRLNDEKRKKIQIGDSIVFTNRDSGEQLKRTVVKLHYFPSFRELYRTLPLLQCGYTQQELAEASPQDMEIYYSAEQQAQYGVVGIELA